MIEINGSFFDEDLRFGMVPDRDHSDGYIALLQNGTKAAFSAAAEDIREAFCIEDKDVDYDPALDMPLYKNQGDELFSLMNAGYEYIAVDDRGIAFAFEAHPIKSGAYWENQPGCVLQPARLKIQGYDAFRDDTAYKIAALLAN